MYVVVYVQSYVDLHASAQKLALVLAKSCVKENTHPLPRYTTRKPTTESDLEYIHISRKDVPYSLSHMTNPKR